MKRFFQNAFTKLKDYFTANLGCKIFFYGLITTTLFFILYAFTHLQLLYIAGVLALVVTGAGTLWDSMQKRTYFLKKVRDMQYEHLKTIHEKQSVGEEVAMTPTFTDEEARYIRRRKWGFILIILFKVGLMIALFSLLLSM